MKGKMKLKAVFMAVILALLLAVSVFSSEEELKLSSEENLSQESNMTQINITVGMQTYAAWLYNNESTQALLELLPQTLIMSELNGNEKFYQFDNSFPANSERLGTIRNGDLMLYGSNYLVLFYKEFQTSYSYTRLGYIEEPEELDKVLGSGSITVTFEIPEAQGGL